jgi:hypothetical protein
MPNSGRYKYYNALNGYVLSDEGQVREFVDGLAGFIKNNLRHRVKEAGKPCQVIISVVLGEDHFGPMVDTTWACAALPCSLAMLRHYLLRCKARLDPPVYRRVKRKDGKNQRIRLLSLHDLRVLRGVMLSRTPGRQALADRGDIEI